MQFNTLEDIDTFVVEEVQRLHPEDLEFIYLVGSFSRGAESRYSDIDYHACVKNPYSHAKLLYWLVELDGIPRILCIYFDIDEKDFPMDPDRITYDHGVWIKGMFAHAKLIYGNEELFNSKKEFYSTLSCTHTPDPQAVHKHVGGMLEHLGHVKRWWKEGNLSHTVFFGMKLAEKAKRAVIEVNDPMQLKTENDYLKALFELKKLPKDFEELYSDAAQLSQKEVALDALMNTCVALSRNVILFLQEQEASVDPQNRTLLESPVMNSYLDFK